MWDKALNVAAKAVVGLFGGTGLSQFFVNYPWFGWILVSSYCDSLSMTLLPVPDDARFFASYGGTLALSGAATDLSPLRLLLALSLMLAFLGHAILRSSVEPDGERPPAGGGRIDRLKNLYLRFYFPLTIGIALLLVVLLFMAPTSFWLSALFFVFLIGGSAYLISFTKDVVGGTFWPRMTYLALAILLAVAILGFPSVYGRNFFKPPLQSASLVDGAAIQLQPGDMPVLLDPANRIFGSIRWFEDQLVLQVHIPTNPPSFKALPLLIDLKSDIELLQPPDPAAATIEESEQAVLKQLGVIGR